MIPAPVRRPRGTRVAQASALVVALVCLLLSIHPPGAAAAGYVKISGSGSTWSRSR